MPQETYVPLRESFLILAVIPLTSDGMQSLRSVDPESLPLVEGTPRIGPCVSGVGKFLCIGLNYSDHAEESGMEVPAEPVLS